MKDSYQNLKIKDPSLKFKYSRGLGDAIASILHGKVFGWLVHLITGKNEPCQRCSMRADALNILFPIPFWRLFFKNAKELTESLEIELQKSGYTVNVSKDGNGITAQLNNISKEEPIQKKEITQEDRNNINNYTFVSNSKSFVGDFLIEINIYKFK